MIRPILVTLATILLVAGCGSAPASPSPVAPGASRPGAAATDGAASALFTPEIHAAAGDPSIERLSAADLAAREAIDERTGTAAFYGLELAGWLRERRSEAVRAAMDGHGMEVTAVGPVFLTAEPVAALEPAVTAAGTAWFGSGMATMGMVDSGAGHVGGPPYSDSADMTKDFETTQGDRHVVETVTIHMTWSTSGSLVIADANVTEVEDTTSVASGAALGHSTAASHIHVEAKMCPDTDGVVAVTVSQDMSGDGTGTPAAGSFTTASTTDRQAKVNDAAFLITEAEQVDVTSTTTPAGGSAETGTVSTSSTSTYGAGGHGRTVTSSTGTIGGTLSPAQASGLYGFTSLLPMLIADRALEKAQEGWRGGKCVRMESSEHSRDVEGGSSVTFDAWPVHKIDGTRLQKPVVGTFQGIFSLSPEGQEQAAPASLTFIAGPDEDDQGTVTLKSTSNRGIGTMDLVFTVRPAIVVELEIDSTVTPQVLTGYTVKSGKATAQGRIRLAEADPGHWKGDGTLASRTTSGGPACRGVKVTGSGSYDWQVRDVVVGPDSAAADIVAFVDSGLATENPDRYTTRDCPGGTFSGVMNTWENLFFTVYNDRKDVNGLKVTGWTLQATPDTWTEGGLIATATWSGTCPAMVVSGGPGQPDIEVPGVLECKDKTTFRLWAVKAP